METSMLVEYGWVLLILVGLEGILAADNAVVMAVMVKHLPEEDRKKALFYGLIGAFIFRFAALFLISFLVNVWQVQAIGAIYLFYVSIHHFVKKKKKGTDIEKTPSIGTGFWMTVLKIELADIAFALDSMLAAVAVAITLQPAGWFKIGGIDGGQFIIMFLGGVIGLVIMRFAATWFVKLLEKYPTLESTAFLIVGWVGVKLAVFTLAHPELGIVDRHFPESKLWKIIFWSVLIFLSAGGYWLSKKKAKKHEQAMK